MAKPWFHMAAAIAMGGAAPSVFVRSGTPAPPRPEVPWQAAHPFRSNTARPRVVLPGSSKYGREYRKATRSAISWSASVGLVQKGIQDVTASIGYEIMSGLSVSLNASQRPNPELVGAYDEDGKYTNFDGDEADYPPVIAWLTLSWAGATVTE